MSKQEVKGVDFFDKNVLEANEKRFKDDVSKLDPKTQKDVLSARQQVQEELDIQNANMNKQFDVEAQMRNATGFTHSATERLMEEMKDALNSKRLRVGQTYLFQGKAFVWTPYKTIVQADLYISSMQDVVLKLTDAITTLEVKVNKSNVTKLTFVDLIKLAFKRLLKGK